MDEPKNFREEAALSAGLDGCFRDEFWVRHLEELSAR